MSVNSKMTAIANAVRDLRGMSGTMGLDAMATNVNGAKTAVDAALAALTEKGVTVPDGTKVDGLSDLIAAIESGGGVLLPEGFILASGSFVPATEGTGTTWSITLAKELKQTGFSGQPVPMFALFRKDGFAASGGDSTRYLTAYIGLAGDGAYGCGAATYRNNNVTDVTGVGGADSSSSFSYGIPFAGRSRSNCYIREVSAYTPSLTFGTYGIVTLESGCEYAWIAILDGSVYQI